MAATIVARVYTGADAGTESGDVTGVDLISADNATNSLANRQANPVAAGTTSYEKWVALVITSPPANSVSNFQLWGDGAVDTTTTLFFTAGYITGATPTNAVSSIADTDFTEYTAGNKAPWDARTLTASGASTRFAVFQLEVGATRGPGAWAQETVTYSWDET